MTLAKSICLAMAASGSATGDVAAAAGSVVAVVVVVVLFSEGTAVMMAG